MGRRILGDDAEAEDMAQEVFLRLWRHGAKFDAGRAKLSTWLYRIAVNLCIDRLRGRRETSSNEVPEQEAPPQQERTLQEGQLAEHVDQALQSLPERQRMALVLFHYQELTMSETAEILDSSVEAVESLLGRAHRTMKKQLERQWRSLLPEEPA